MKKQMQAGFTLIELVVVIVILGILAAVAIPKFVDLKTEASTAAVQGVAGAAASAMTINYAGCAALNNVATANKCVKVTNCTDASTLIQGGLPTGYTITAAAIGGAGVTVTCTVTGQNAATATFAGIGT